MAHPSGLTSEQIEEYLYRSYTRVDGLWFVLTEERHGFDDALALDQSVWKVMPKIQARLLQQQLSVAHDITGLAGALKAKLALDRYGFDLVETDAGIELKISTCPWHELIVRSGREHLAKRIGGIICGIEFPALAREFACSCSGPSEQRLCTEGAKCSFTFSTAGQ